MSAGPTRGAYFGLCGGQEEGRAVHPRQSDHVGLTQANRLPRRPVRLSAPGCRPPAGAGFEALPSSCSYEQGAMRHKGRQRIGSPRGPESTRSPLPFVPRRDQSHLVTSRVSLGCEPARSGPVRLRSRAMKRIATSLALFRHPSSRCQGIHERGRGAIIKGGSGLRHFVRRELRESKADDRIGVKQ